MPENDWIWLFFLLLPIVAFMYASVGHGGASGYLGLMALFGFSTVIMKPTALLLNIFVAGISFIQYYRKGHFRWSLFYPFAVASIPAAFIGGYINIEAGLYKNILAGLLIFAILRMLGIFGKGKEETSPIKLSHGLITGALIGLFSGMIGIGGGIILSPVILLFGWSKIKETAAISALFIWVNSIAGMMGLYMSNVQVDLNAYLFAMIAVVGGLAGAYFGSARFNNQALLRMLAVVLILACIKLVLI